MGIGAWSCESCDSFSFCSESNSLQQVEPEMQPFLRRQFADTDVDHDDEPLERLRLLESFNKAVTKGNTGMVTYHIGEHPNEDLANNRYNEEAPLHVAVQHKQYKLIQYLLSQGANPNTLNEEANETPLHIACRDGDLKAVQILCQHNADTTIENEYQETALCIALQHDTRPHREVAIYLKPDADTLRQLDEKNKKSILIERVDTSIANVTASVAEVLKTSTLSPFSPFSPSFDRENVSTRELIDITDGVVEDIQEDFSKRLRLLRPLESWLERKQQSLPYAWLKRWVVVKHEYLLWSERQITVDADCVSAREKRRWNKCVHLKAIQGVETVEGNTNQRFMIKVNDKEYVFKANCENLRDYWVHNLKEHIECYRMGRNALLKGTAAEPGKLKRIL